nr:MAG: putative RNA-dependent RNA polymerase [Picobirnaviridae sp.]
MEKVPYMIKEIIDNYDLILREAMKIQNPRPLSQEEKENGLRVSKLGASTPKDVKMSPLVSEALKRTGEKVDDKWRLMATDPETKAERWINDVELSLLNQFNGPEKTEFNENLPLTSIEHYNVQCWRNRKLNKRDIGPDQEKEREEVVDKYRRETKAMDLRKLLATDVVFQKAVMLVCRELPEVRANNDFNLVSQPFMNKDSNVSYPFFRNDRAVDPGTGLTYGQMAIDLAKRTPVDQLYKYNYTTLFGRNQKLKGRAIYATSRVVNIVLNQLEAEEISAYKEKSSLFVGYNDDTKLKEALIQMTDSCNKLGLKCRNVDQSKFDLHVNEAFIILVGSISMMKANGTKSKRIAQERAVLATKTWLIDGLANKITPIYGRIFSGYIDTNRMGGLINAIAVLYSIMKQDENYSDYVYKMVFWMMVMGDDNLFIYNKLDYDKFKADLESIGFEVNKEKDEYGPFFLQYRLFDYNGEKVMAYSWTRVWRSILFKETQKGLGPYGWTLAWWQQIAKVIEYKPSLTILVNLVAYLDDNKLCLDMPIHELLKKIDEEDNSAKDLKARTQNARSRFEGTWDKLSDGDPQKARFTRENTDYLTSIQKAMREVYDPNFFNKYHLPHLQKR